MPSKLPLLMLLLVVGSALLVASLTLDLPAIAQWALLIIGVVLNVTSAVSLMVMGIKRTKPS